jgi:flagellar basal-body rod modification protein FlgD
MVMAHTSDRGPETDTDSFLALFVKQLQYQNPSDLQLNVLEQEQQPEYLLTMGSVDVASLQVDQLSMASSFIGKTITYTYKGRKGGSDNTSTGMVEGVELEKDGTVSFVIGGYSIPMANFVEVTSPSQWMLAGLFGSTM